LFVWEISSLFFWEIIVCLFGKVGLFGRLGLGGESLVCFSLFGRRLFVCLFAGESLVYGRVSLGDDWESLFGR